MFSYFKSGKKNTNDENVKKTVEEEGKDSEEEEDDSYLKTRSDMPSGTGKHIQKKAKKQAKKQAKVGNYKGSYAFSLLCIYLLVSFNLKDLVNMQNSGC